MSSSCPQYVAMLYTLTGKRHPVRDVVRDVWRRAWRLTSCRTSLASRESLETTQKAVKSRKMVRFWGFKRLGPLKKGCPTAWNGHLGNRTVGNALFVTQTPFRPVAMATDTLNSNLTWTPYHLLWVLVWSVHYPERRYASNKQIMANYIEMSILIQLR